MALNIYEALKDFGPIIALLLQARLLSRFLDPRNRDYPIAILFSFILFLVTSASHFFDNYSNDLPRELAIPIRNNFFSAYAGADLFMHIFLLVLMLQLIHQTLQYLSLGTTVLRGLTIVSILVALGAFFYFRGNQNKHFYLILVETRQVASFWMVLLNLYWWTLLLKRRQLDRRILLLSAGIGLLMTGQVIGDSIMSFAKVDLPWIGISAVLIMYLTHYACLHSWYNAFNPKLAKPLT